MATSHPTNNFSVISWIKENYLKVILSLLLAVGFIWMMSKGGLPVFPEKEAYRNVAWWSVAAYAIVFLISQFFRASRWRHLLCKIGEVKFSIVLAVSFLSSLFLLILPLRSGEFARPVLISRRSNIRILEAAGTIGAERIFDGLIISSILLASVIAAAPIYPMPHRIGELPVSPESIPKGSLGAFVLFVSAFVIMTAFYFFREIARKVTIATLGIFSLTFAKKMADIIGRLADGIGFLPSPSHFFPFLLESLAYWMLNLVGLWLLAWGCGLTAMTFAQAGVVLGCISLGLLAPAGPGYYGVFQLSAYVALSRFISLNQIQQEGAVFVFILYLTQILAHVLVAILAFLLDRDVMTNAKPTQSPTSNLSNDGKQISHSGLDSSIS